MPDEFIYARFCEQPEDFPLLVKKALIESINELTAERKTATKDGKTVVVSEKRNESLLEIAKQHLTITIVEAKKIRMHDWTADYEGVPVAVECQVVGANIEETYTKSAIAKCWKCEYSVPIVDIRKHIPDCGNSNCSRYEEPLEIDRSSLKTGQTRIILIQEPMNEAKHGNPRMLPCIIKDSAVQETFIGQHKKIIGVFRSHEQDRKITNKIMIHAISVQDIEASKVKLPSQQQIKKFTELSTKPEYLEVIHKSFAPEIYGERLAKLCIIFSRLGGVTAGRLRGEIHALLCGDPGEGKSKILEFLTEVTDNCGFAVGGTMTGSGVTVSLDTLPNRQKIPRAGIVVLCNGSNVALDELNQLGEEDLGKLFEAMESGKIHYNKAGFNEELEAATSISAAINPKNYVYDFDQTIVDNINLPIPLIERFDLKVNMTGEKGSTDEQLILDHILKIRNDGVDKYIAENSLLAREELYLLLNYAKQFQPKMSDKAAKLLKAFHMLMKNMEQRDGSMRVNRRFFESVYRIATGYAKLMFSDMVSEEYAMLAIEIFKLTLKSFRMNTEKEGVVLDLHHQADNADTAFRHCWRTLEVELKAEYVPEKILLDKLVAGYSNFKQFANLEKAQAYFDRMYNVGKITKSGGLYKLQ